LKKKLFVPAMPNALLAPADVHGLIHRGFIEINVSLR
jgi:hypothetical protein